MKRTLLTLLVALVIAVGCGRVVTSATVPTAAQVMQTADSRLSDAAQTRLKAAIPALSAYLARVLPSVRLPALRVGIIGRAGLVYSTGWVHAETTNAAAARTPSDATLFRVGSITKTLTALTALHLRDRGALQLDVPVATYLPELAGLVYPSRDSPPITLRHLLSHTSGLPRIGGTPPLLDQGGRGAEEPTLLAALRGLALVTAPGSGDQPAYSNLGYAIVGLTIARVTGQPYRDYVTQALLRPLQMRSTSFLPEPSAELAPGYVDDGGSWRAAPATALGAFDAAGGLYSNMEDMAKYVQLQLQAWPPRSDPEDLSVARGTVRESQLSLGMQRPGASEYGAGWQSLRDEAQGWQIEHDGATLDGYSAFVAMAPTRGVGVVILSNGLSAETTEVVTLGRALLREALTLSAPAPSAREAQAAMRLLALAQTWSASAAQAVFTARFLREVGEPALRALLAELEASRPCQVRFAGEPTEPDGGAFLLACASCTWRVRVSFASSADTRLAELVVERTALPPATSAP